MKKLVLIVALMLSVVSFAGETRNVNLFNNQNSKDVVQNENLVTEEKSNQELFTEFCNTTVWWHIESVKKLTSLDDDVEITQTTIVIDLICETCFSMGHSGVTSTTNCW